MVTFHKSKNISEKFSKIDITIFNQNLTQIIFSKIKNITLLKNSNENKVFISLNDEIYYIDFLN